jgi:hypothetical protein
VVSMNVKYLLCALGGASIGYFVAQGRFEKYFKEQLALQQDEHELIVKALKESYEERIQDLTADVKSNPEVNTVGDEKVVDTITKSETLKLADDAASALLTYSGGAVQYNRVVFSGGAADSEEVAASVPDSESVREIISNFAFEKASEISESDPQIAEDGVVTMSAVDENLPFIITEDAYMNEEAGYKQYSLTYFSGDDVLAGESDNKIEEDFRRDVLGSAICDVLIAGPEAMNGEKVLYVRNVPLQREFEIAWSEGKYSFEVGESAG